VITNRVFAFSYPHTKAQYFRSLSLNLDQGAAGADLQSFPFQTREVSALHPCFEVGLRRNGFGNVRGAELVVGRLACRDYICRYSVGENWDIIVMEKEIMEDELPLLHEFACV
jgi:hypothetical protein